MFASNHHFIHKEFLSEPFLCSTLGKLYSLLYEKTRNIGLSLNKMGTNNIDDKSLLANKHLCVCDAFQTGALLPTMSSNHSQKEPTKALSPESQGVNISVPGPPLNTTIANCFSFLYSRNTCSSLFHAAPAIANASQGRGFLWKYSKLFKVTANMCGLALGTFSPIVTGPWRSAHRCFLPFGYGWQVNFYCILISSSPRNFQICF